jgi:two-component system response regulator RegA
MISANALFLVVDDDGPFRTRLVSAIHARGYQAQGAATPEEAIRLATEINPTHIILDLRMPTGSGLEVLRAVKKINTQTNVLILTGYGSIATALNAMREGAFGYLSKPTDLDSILQAFTCEPKPEPTKENIPSLPRVEWEHIQRVLTDCEGNISKAAKLLGLHRRSLQRKLKNPPL